MEKQEQKNIGTSYNLGKSGRSHLRTSRFACYETEDTVSPTNRKPRQKPRQGKSVYNTPALHYSNAPWEIFSGIAACL